MKQLIQNSCPACGNDLIACRLFASKGLELHLPKDSWWQKIFSASILPVDISFSRKNNAFYCRNCGLIFYYLPEDRKFAVNDRLQKETKGEN